MNSTLLQDARKRALQMNANQQSRPDIISEVSKRLFEYFSFNTCPIVTELLLSFYEHPIEMTPKTAAVVLTNHSSEPTWVELPIPDLFGNKLYQSTRKEQNIWSVVCARFPNVFRNDIFFAPFRNKNLGFEIITYSFDTRMHSNSHIDLPREFAVDMIARDPRILS